MTTINSAAAPDVTVPATVRVEAWAERFKHIVAGQPQGIDADFDFRSIRPIGAKISSK